MNPENHPNESIVAMGNNTHAEIESAAKDRSDLEAEFGYLRGDYEQVKQRLDEAKNATDSTVKYLQDFHNELKKVDVSGIANPIVFTKKHLAISDKEQQGIPDHSDIFPDAAEYAEYQRALDSHLPPLEPADTGASPELLWVYQDALSLQNNQIILSNLYEKRVEWVRNMATSSLSEDRLKTEHDSFKLFQEQIFEALDKIAGLNRYIYALEHNQSRSSAWLN